MGRTEPPGPSCPADFVKGYPICVPHLVSFRPQILGFRHGPFWVGERTPVFTPRNPFGIGYAGKHSECVRTPFRFWLNIIHLNVPPSVRR